MRFEFKVTAEVERYEGKFASRADLGDQIREAIEQADPGDLTGEAGGSYSITDWQVEEA